VLREVAQRHPRVLCKVHRAYLCHGLSVEQRFVHLQRHHTLARQLLGAAWWERVMRHDDTCLCPLHLPQGHGTLSVRLLHAHHYEREGDLSLVLDDPFGTPLYTLTFSFEDTPQGPGVLIGALQGQLTLDVSRHLTKLCWGVRPPNLLLWVLQTWALTLGVRRLRAVGMARHVYAGSRLVRHMHFDYDAFWQSVGGEAGRDIDDGFYSLDLQPPRRAREDIPAHKRSQYQRRYAWLDGLATDLHAHWSQPPGPRPNAPHPAPSC